MKKPLSRVSLVYRLTDGVTGIALSLTKFLYE